MWPVIFTAMRTYAPYVTFPVAFVVGAVGYHLEWFIRGTPNAPGEERGIAELREDRKLEELAGRDGTQVLSLKDKLEFSPRAVLEKNRPEKSTETHDCIAQAPTWKALIRFSFVLHD
ncbi:small integral membrane protein 12-like isoform X1 [Myxocyprinus asiaticus]|uniref:small integral membrane protein 12-like isoform X1 n=2 Tax=Myxocyprinus asiaticus TaxID=70543 RepID=UPI002223AB7A|nr:small integral membrane protein 12-like isoform X1 [Myxocyprinus asiaticus]XP_051527147.1 small integral membrane protein 12-like isoform X1 [Myxocyprinus asiaticus]